MNPRQSRLGVSTVITLMTVTSHPYLDCDMKEVGLELRQLILRDDRVEPFSPAGALSQTRIFFFTSLIRENLHAQDKAFRLKHKQVG